MKAIILAGGKGTRLAPYTKILPKPLMPIGDLPIVEILMRQMRRAGVRNVTLTVGYLAHYLRLFFQDGQDLGLNICYSVEDKPLGTAGPLTLIDDLDETFLVANGDVLTTLDLRKIIAYHHQQGAVATIAMHPRQVKIDLGVIQLNGDNTVQDYLEKPCYDYMVSMGIYVFQPAVLQYIPHNQYFDFPELVQALLAAGQKVIGYPFHGYWQDLGNPQDYEQAMQDFQKMRPQFLPEEI